jgi:ATP-dependent helicase/nuclease subunit A
MPSDLCELYGVNEEQARALDINQNTALRAGAGSGKTRVLTKRFVKCLLEKPTLTLDNIAAITFTRKAATEMKDRIRRELSDRISKIADADEKKRLSNIKMQITNANIDTIHGFCGKILRDHFDYPGLDPDFKILEEVDKSVLLSEIADRVIHAFIENKENEDTVRFIAGNFSTGFFTGKLKQGIISAFQNMREKGTDPCKFEQNLKTGDIEDAGPVTVLERTAFALVIGLDNEYSTYKEKENLLDFNDVEILSERLLRNDDIRTSYFSRFTTIMVDEFQDVNPLQKKILDLLTFKDGKIPSGRFFIVGDHKQSIYGFRGSDYRVFEEACAEVSSCGRIEYLNNCYRSTKNIIGAVNSIFSQLLNPYEKLRYPGQENSCGRKVELITWEKATLKENKPKTRWDSVKSLLLSDESKEELMSALEAEYEDTAAAGKKNYQGDVIAGVIKKLTSEGFSHSDIAILLRSRTSLSEIENSLTRNEIPYCVLGGIGFWDRQEIGDILSLYKLVFSPDDRLALFTALRSPIFGFSDDMLLALSIFMRKENIKNLDELMAAFAHAVSNDDKWLVRRTADVLTRLLPMEGILNSLELLNRIITVTAYDEILTALPQGEKKLRNIEKLIRIVEEFDAKGVYSARELLPYLDALKESSGMDGEAFLDNEDSDAVKILTIHASKGLEFRAVLIPDMDRLLDSQAKRNKPLFFFDEQKGLIAMGLDESFKLNETANSEYEKRYAEKLLRELEDSRRLFYVAATRAREYLAFIGEKQEVGSEETECSLNSFMKQLLWAINKAGSSEEITSVDAMSLIPGRQKQWVYPPVFIAEMKKLAEANSIENTPDQRPKPCST